MRGLTAAVVSLAALLAGLAGPDPDYVDLDEAARTLGLTRVADGLTGREFLRGGGHEAVLAPRLRTVLADGTARAFPRAPRRIRGRVEIPREVQSWLLERFPPAPVAVTPPPEPAPAPTLAPALAGLRIVVDPGHGGRFAGSLGPRGIIEKDVNLAIARQVAARLEQAGAAVRLTRPDDRHLDADWATDLRMRTDLARAVGADLFVSIHANSADNSSARGFEVYVCRSDSDVPRRAASRRLAEQVRRGLASIGIPDRGVREGDYRVLVGSPCPAILVEVEFLSNSDGASRLTDPTFQSRVGEAVAAAVRQYRSGR